MHIKKTIPIINLLAITSAPLFVLAGCANTDIADITINLTEDASSGNIPFAKSSSFTIDTTKTYRFNVDASVCEKAEKPWCQEYYYTFAAGTYRSNIWEYVDINVLFVNVKGVGFDEAPIGGMLTPGKFMYQEDHKSIVVVDWYNVNPTFKMSVTLKFTASEGDEVVARWYPGT